MNLSNFLALKASELTRYIQQDALRIIAKEGRDHFRESFQNEGFTDATIEPWKEVKRRQEDRMKRNKNGSVSKRQGRDQKRKILTDTGDLKNSITTEVRGMTVEVGTDLDYAEPHNEGTTNAGRGNNTTISQRQFIGESQALNEKIENQFEKDITKILKQ
jgi:phage gpG-like protein